MRCIAEVLDKNCGEGNAVVSCSEVHCEGACDAGSAEVNLVRCSAEVLDKLVVKATRR